jgi:hypothetical protein
MNDYIARFQASPTSFKKSFAFLTAAWICHPLFVYSLFYFEAMVDASGTELKKMVVVSLSLCVFLFLIKKWARALVVVGSLSIVVNDLFFFLVSPRNQITTLLLVAVVLCTIIGIYWLFVSASRDYFTQVNPKPEPPDVTAGPSRRR